MSIQIERKAMMRDYDREMLKSAFASLFWNILGKRKESGLTMAGLAKTIGVNKSVVSRWFQKPANWEIHTISDLANAFEVDIRVHAIDRKTGAVFTASGTVAPKAQETSTQVNTVKRIDMFDGRPSSKTVGDQIDLRKEHLVA